MIDACRVGLCELYDTGGGTLALIVGAAIGAAIIVLVIRHRRRPK